MPRSKHPNRRPSYNLEFTHGRAKYICSYSVSPIFITKESGDHYSLLRPFEVFMQAGKAGSDLEAMARDAAVVTSLALQHGCSVETIRSALTQGELDQPAGPLGVLLDLLSVELEKLNHTDPAP